MPTLPDNAQIELLRMRVKANQNWTCPHCGNSQVVDDSRLHSESTRLNVEPSALGNGILFFVQAISCANSRCRELTLSCVLAATIPQTRTASGTNVPAKEKLYGLWTLRPVANSKPQQNCVPEALRNDYYEACAIKDLSPKASATLSRRCLQGAIRDFCRIKKDTLDLEIKALAKLVEDGTPPPGVQAKTIEAIHAVRKIGNIGAHMEKDIDVIIDVEPEEAQLLIGLIELIFADWYVETERRKIMLTGIIESAAAKELQRKAPPPEQGN